MKRPLIAVTGPDKNWPFGWWATRFILWLQGARSCYVTPGNSSLPKAVEAVVIGGGDDIDPQHYGESGNAGVSYDAARDELEIAMIKSALKAEIPILGICRGAQLINIVLGGSLYQDIRPFRTKTPNRNSVFVIKTAFLEKNSSLLQILGSSVVKINSLHSQAVNRIGDGLTVAARDEDGFIQAFEHKDKSFLIGVQWHPEYLPYHSRQRALFKEMIMAAKRQFNSLSPDSFYQFYDV